MAAQTNLPVIECQAASYHADGIKILSGVNLSVAQNAWMGVLGPSGSGKSTLLRCLNRLISISSGDIIFMQTSIQEYDPKELRRRLCLIQQKPAMLQGSVRHNLLIAQTWNNTNEIAPGDLDQILEQVELDISFLDKDARTLSGGEQQRVALARGLLNKPDVLLLDEPTSSLDPNLADRILKIIDAIRKEYQLTVVMVSHHHTLLQRFATHAAFIIKGELMESGTVDVLNNPTHPKTRNFLNRAD